MLYKLDNSIRLEKVYENKEIKPGVMFEEKWYFLNFLGVCMYFIAEFKLPLR